MVLARAQKDPEFFKCIKEVRGPGGRLLCGGCCEYVGTLAARTTRRLLAHLVLTAAPSPDQRDPNARHAPKVDRPPYDWVGCALSCRACLAFEITQTTPSPHTELNTNTNTNTNPPETPPPNRNATLPSPLVSEMFKAMMNRSMQGQ